MYILPLLCNPSVGVLMSEASPKVGASGPSQVSENKKIVGYLRTATARETTAEAMREEIYDYSRQHFGRSCDLMLVDAGVSGMVSARPGLERLFAVIRSGEAGAVVSTDPSRLSRNSRKMLWLLDVFAEHDVSLHCTRTGGMLAVSLLDCVAPLKDVPIRRRRLPVPRPNQ